MLKMKLRIQARISFLFCIILSTSCIPSLLAAEQEATKDSNELAMLSEMRIVSLSPHLTELSFLLGRGEQLVAVSDFSDYPEQANLLPSVANYQGADLAAILRLEASHVLAWQGGNKSSDIQKLKDNGLLVHQSSINDIDSLINDILNLGVFLNAEKRALELAASIKKQRNELLRQYQNHSKRGFYYLNHKPLLALGNDSWLNDLLSICGIKNIFVDSIAPYPQVELAQVLRLQPELIIAALSSDESSNYFWERHKGSLHAEFLRVNPDKLHRFTPRALDEVSTLCRQVYTNAQHRSTVTVNN